MMTDKAAAADAATILTHLRHVTRRWHELGEPVLFETVCLTPTDNAQVRDPRRWRLDQLAEAAAHMAAMNAHRLNCYYAVNPVRADAVILAGKRAKAEHIAASFFHFADADTAESAAAIRNFVGPLYTFYVLTGTQPVRRPHVYWELEEPTRNLAAWKATQEAIAAAFGSDAVTDPSRLMRLAGTINWPKPNKVARGYVAEVTTLGIIEDNPPISAERMAIAFKTAAHAKARTGPAGQNGPDIDTGLRDDKGERFATYLRQCAIDGQKHTGVRGVSAMLGARAVEIDLVSALVRHVCPVWDENVESLIQSAYKFAPQEELGGIEPVDLWGLFSPPLLMRGVLPPVIEEFAFQHGETMGADPGGLAASALAVCCAAIPDRVRVKVKRHDDWTESARLWVALVGDPSTKKSPVIGVAERPLRKIDTDLFRQFIAAKAEYDALKKDEKAEAERPRQLRRRLEDTTIEAAQEVMADSPDGLLVVQDELSGWFGSMDRYSNGKGKDRAFWLQAFNGGHYAFNRVGRGAGMVPNLSACVLGGIQPEPIRKVVEEASDDGLIQRLLPIVLRPAVLGSEDEPKSNTVDAYGRLVEGLTKTEVGRAMAPAFHIDTGGSTPLIFEDGAQAIRRQLEKKHLELMSVEAVNRKLAAHIGKYDGIFARLCVAFHCIEHGGGMVPTIIAEATARRVARFLHGFLLPHAIAFYGGVLDLSDDHDRLTAVAGYILTHGLETVSARDVARGDGTMRKLTRSDTVRVFEQLEALGWVAPQPTPARANAAPVWVVNPEVHRRFAERRANEAARRQRAKASIAEAAKWRP